MITASFIHLKKSEFTKFTAELPTVSPRILLSGPAGELLYLYLYCPESLSSPLHSQHDLLFINISAGSEIYQEMLSKALANHFGAKLLIFDTNQFLGVSFRLMQQFFLFLNHQRLVSLRTVYNTLVSLHYYCIVGFIFKGNRKAKRWVTSRKILSLYQGTSGSCRYS